MKIPTQQNNTKRVTLAAGAVAMVVGVATPTIALAHGGDRTDKSGSWHQEDRRNDRNNRWHGLSWLSWDKISADDFTNWNEANLARIDRYIDKNNLTIENGDALRDAVDTNAANVADNLKALNELRDSTGDLKDATDEQREALKTQSAATFSAFYDYKVSLYDYTVAIKTAANASGVKYDSSIEQQ